MAIETVEYELNLLGCMLLEMNAQRRFLDLWSLSLLDFAIIFRGAILKKIYTNDILCSKKYHEPLEPLVNFAETSMITP